MTVQKENLHHLILIYNTSRYKFSVMLEIITILKIKDNNRVLVIILLLIFIFNFVRTIILLLRTSLVTWKNLTSHRFRTAGITRYLVHNINTKNAAVYYT